MDHAFKLAVAVAVAGLVACSSDDGQPSSSSGTSGTSSGAQPTPEGGTAKKENAEVGCNADDECESTVCFKGGNQTFCSLKCTADNAATVCAAPFTGSCNKQGFCKRD